MKRVGWLIMVFVIIVLAGSVFSADRDMVISKITVLVDGQRGDETVNSLIGLKPGDPYSDFRIDQSLKQLMRTGFFSRIEVYWTESPNPELIFNLGRNIFIRNIRISAPRSISRRISSELTFLKKGSVLSEATSKRSIKEIERILRDEGLFSPEIKFETRRIEDSNRVDVEIRLPDWKRLTIRQLLFKGPNIISEDRLRKLLGLNPGDFYVPKKLGRGLTEIKKAYNKIGYRWAEAGLSQENFDQERGFVDLTVNINPSVKINIEITGANISPKLVEPVWEQKVFEEWAIAEGESILLKHLRKKGYVFASIRPKIKRNENELQVIYEVHPGAKLKIKEIEFRGTTNFSAKYLKKALGIGEKFLFLPYLDGQEIYDLPERIRLFYEEQGFPQTQVGLNFIRKDGSVAPVIYIDEGPHQVIKSLEIQGAITIPAAEIVSQLDSRPGSAYYKPALQKDVEKINLMYLNKGFRGTQINVEAVPDRENNFDLVIRISEGRRMKVDNIFISGNHLTAKEIILREVNLREGDWADYNRLLQTKRGLDSLGVFSEVKLEELPSTENSVNVSIQVREGEQNFTSLGLGMETKEEVRSVALWENNPRPRITAEYIRYNLLRNASQLSFVGQLSVVEKRLVATWQQPYIFSLKMRTYFSGYLEKEDRTSFSFERRGFSLSTMRNLPANFALLLATGALRTRLTNLEISESEVDRERLPYSIAYGSATFIQDRRDDTFNPQNGYFFSLALERAYPLLHTESDFIKLFAKFQYFYLLATNINFYTTFRLGLASGTVPIPERFFAGGSNSFRGEAFEMLGPKDPASGLPLGGKAVFLLNMETKFLLLKKLPNLYGAVFYDVGKVYPEIKDFNFLELSQAIGLGLRYTTPLGPIRFDMGWNLNPSQRRWKPLFFLTIGNMF
jgi:outer membrane protein assembly complex protein YaeT